MPRGRGDRDRAAVREAGERNRIDRQPAEDVAGDGGDVVVLMQIKTVRALALPMAARIGNRRAIAVLVEQTRESEHRRVTPLAPEARHDEHQRTGTDVVQVVSDLRTVKSLDDAGDRLA